MPAFSTAKLNVLVAFPYFSQSTREELEQNRGSYRLIVDSGAFTAWNSGKTIDLDAYCRFLDSIEHLRPFHAIQLDVFGDPEASQRNFETMVSRGYDVMPVFTRGESVERLEELYAATDYIMFGGIVTGGKNRNYIKWFTRVNGNRKAHWLGFVKMDFIKKFRPESVDSSTWVNGARYGLLLTFNLETGEHAWWKRSVFATRPPEEVMACMRSLRVPYAAVKLLGFNASWRATTKPPPWASTMEYAPAPTTAHLLATMGHIARMLWTEVSYGTKIYLAAGAHHTRNLFAAYNYGKALGAW